jgi:hypothetical protein
MLDPCAIIWRMMVGLSSKAHLLLLWRLLPLLL